MWLHARVHENWTMPFEPKSRIRTLHESRVFFTKINGKCYLVSHNSRFHCISLWTVLHICAPNFFAYIYTLKNIIHNNYHRDSEIYTSLLRYSKSASISKFGIFLAYLHLSSCQDMAPFSMVNRDWLFKPHFRACYLIHDARIPNSLRSQRMSSEIHLFIVKKEFMIKWDYIHEELITVLSI